LLRMQHTWNRTKVVAHSGGRQAAGEQTHAYDVHIRSILGPCCFSSSSSR
jgi:hypothetical protein